MLPKNARKTPFESARTQVRPFFGLAKKLFLVSVGLEIAILGASYYGFRKLNDSVDSRLHCSKHYPYVLEGYYYITDNVAGNNLREQDRAAWALTGWEENDES